MEPGFRRGPSKKPLTDDERRRVLAELRRRGNTPAIMITALDKDIDRLQGLRIGAAGTAWGLGVAVPFCLLADRFRLIHLPASLYDFITYVPFRLGVLDLLAVAAFPLLISWWAARFPARRAAATPPVAALATEAMLVVLTVIGLSRPGTRGA